MILETNYAKIEVQETGGELISILLKETDQELLVKNNSWGRTAPWLFPVVGELHDNFFRHDGKIYKMPRHGFVRGKKWVLKLNKNNISATYSHKSNDEYPFDFKVVAKYTINKDHLNIEFDIKAKDEVRYNLGWHPALNYKGDVHVNSTFEYESVRNKLIGHKFNELKELTFKELENDKTYIFDNFTAKLDYKDKPIYIESHNFNFLAIWTKNKEEFISLEPWAKNLDLMNATPTLENKDLLNGNNKLNINIYYETTACGCFSQDDLII